jgi:hypothetical protein
MIVDFFGLIAVIVARRRRALNVVKPSRAAFVRSLLPSPSGCAWISLDGEPHHEIERTSMGSLGARSARVCNHHLHRYAASCNQAGHRAVGRWLKVKKWSPKAEGK